MAFAKLKTLLRKAAACTCDDLWKSVGTVCDLFPENECLKHFIAAGHKPDWAWQALIQQGEQAMIDFDIRQSALVALTFEPSIDAASIGVAVDNGIVTLTGHVPTYAEKLKAEELAMAVHGVKGIAQEIDVRPVGTHPTADDEIARRILDGLRWSTSLPTDVVKVKIKVQSGWDTQSGTVEWYYQRVRCATWPG